MSFSVQTVTAGLVAVLRNGTTWKVGDSAMPDNASSAEPYGILEFIPGGPSYGGLAGNLQMSTLMYQLKIVGSVPEQARRFHDKMVERLDTAWQSVQGLMGPPRIVTGGIVQTDNQTFEGNVTIYVEVTET